MSDLKPPWGSQDCLMPRTFRPNASLAEVVGRTPWSARDALVPLPEQRYQHIARREQADGGVGRGPGGPPHQTSETARCGEKYAALGKTARPTKPAKTSAALR